MAAQTAVLRIANATVRCELASFDLTHGGFDQPTEFLALFLAGACFLTNATTAT
jgi:hypothetical protein